MTFDTRPLRSVLYIPASKVRALEKARGLAADAIIFDLEDAVAPEEKTQARETLATALRDGGYGARLRLVRINGQDTEWGKDDIDAVARMAPDAILVPKVNNGDEIAALHDQTKRPIWAMMETATGILNAATIARASGIAGFVIGSNDLAKELGARTRGALGMALQHTLMAARAGGIPCIDGVFNAFKDEDGLRAECMDGRDLGMDGKTLIHPAQIDIANDVFAPSDAELDLARRQMAAFAEAQANGEGVAVVDGRIVENLHIETARAILAKAKAIADMAAAT
ncbi:MAG: CoA ester lyase [Pseudomonadota bacterium]